MNANALAIRTVGFAAALTVLCPAPALCGDAQPAEPEKDGGLLGALRGTHDPARQPRRSPPAAPAAERDKAAPPGPPVAPLARSVPDPKRLDEGIGKLESLGYGDVRPVADLEEARQQIARLRRQARAMRLRADERNIKTVNRMAERTRRVRDKWSTLIAALNDGKQRDSRQWFDVVKRTVQLPAAVEAELDAAAQATKQADEALDLPSDDELAAELGEEPPPAEDEKDLLKPVEEPKAETEVKRPELGDLAKAIKGHAKPEEMPPLLWARLIDAFEKDVADLHAAVAAARKRLKDRSAAEFEPVAEALRAAQRTYSRIRESGGKPPEWMRRQLAWRMHQAELAQMRLVRDDLKALAQERQGKASDRELWIRTDPLAPEHTLADLARLMQVDGRPGAPKPDAFDDIAAEGLGPLYPEGAGTVVDGRVHYGNLVRANIDRLQGALRDVRRQIAHADEIVAAEDRRERLLKWSELLRQDRLEGRADHPIDRAQRRVALKEMYRDQLKSRPDRVAKRKAELEGQAGKIVKQLEREYKRRDAMRAGEKELEPKPEKKEGANQE